MSDTDRDLDPGAFIGHEPELASERIPGGVQPDDDRSLLKARGGPEPWR